MRYFVTLLSLTSEACRLQHLVTFIYRGCMWLQSPKPCWLVRLDHLSKVPRLALMTALTATFPVHFVCRVDKGIHFSRLSIAPSLTLRGVPGIWKGQRRCQNVSTGCRMDSSLTNIDFSTTVAQHDPGLFPSLAHISILIHCQSFPKYTSSTGSIDRSTGTRDLLLTVAKLFL